MGNLETKNANYIYAFIPENLDLESQLKAYPPPFYYRPEDIDNFRYIINLITKIPMYKKDMLDEDGYVPISTSKLQIAIRDYSQNIKYLEKQEIMETKKSFIEGEKCRRYRFTPRYRTFVKVELITKISLVKRHKKRKRNGDEMRKMYPYLAKWWNTNLKIDFQGAVEWLNAEYERNRMTDDNAMGKRNINYVNAYRFQNETFTFLIDTSAKRVHTNLTSLKSELRNYVTYGGQSLVSIDIRNSQPYLSISALDKDFYRTDCTIREGKLTIGEVFNFNPSLQLLFPISYSSTTSPSITFSTPSLSPPPLPITLVKTIIILILKTLLDIIIMRRTGPFMSTSRTKSIGRQIS